MVSDGGRWPAQLATACVIAAWALACGPLVAHGFPHGHDASYELFRVAGYRNALVDGQWPPYWGGGFFVGYGSPIYVFYAPAFMTLATLLTWLSGSLLSASAAAAALVLLAGAAAAYGAARAALAPVESAVRHQLACITAIVCLLHPYTLGTLYLRNALAEFSAICLFPLMLWGGLSVHPAAKLGPWIASRRIAAVVALAVLTHNLSALVGAAFLIVTALVGCLRPGEEPPRRAIVDVPRTLALVGGFALALALSAYFWLPALGYQDLTRTAVELREGKLDFHNNFVPWLSNFGLSEFYGGGPLMLGALAVGLCWPAHRLRVEPLVPRLRPLLVLFACLLLCLLLPVTTPVWEAVPFLPLMQFPFRFLGPLGFVGALGLARLLAPLFERWAPKRWPWCVLAVLLIAGTQGAVPLSRARSLPEEVRRGFDAAATPDAVRNNPGAMATFRWEYIPPTADRELWKRDPTYQGALHRTAGAVRASVVEDAPRRVVIDVEVAGEDAEDRAAPLAAVVLRRYWVPGFEATLDGSPVATEAAPDGLVAVGLPQGKHRLVVSLEPPPLRRIGCVASLLGLLGLLGIGGLGEGAARRARIP